MNTPVPSESTHTHDVFISYSRKDADFASALERALESYTPPKGLGAARGHLRVFRDQSDLTGVEYHESIARHLRDSRKLIALCSPRARASTYVNEEIQQFAAVRGAQNIIPLLIDGVPNNEAPQEHDEQKAFPEALCEAMQMPLAGEYRHFNARKDKLSKGVFYGSWYTLLANVLDVSRSEIEQRDRKRAARRRAVTIGIVSGVIALLSVAFVMTLFAQREAVRQRDQAEHRRFVALAQLVAGRAAEYAAQGQSELAVLLARQAYLFDSRHNGDALAQVDAALRAATKTQPETHEVRSEVPVHTSAVDPRRTLLAVGTNDIIKLWNLADANAEPRALKGHEIDVVSLAFSPDGKQLASGSWDSTVRLWDLSAREPTSRALRGHTNYVLVVTFSPDGRWLVSGGNDATVRIWNALDSNAEPAILRIPDGVVRSLAFAPDGRILAAGTSVGTIWLWDRTAPDAQPRLLLPGGENVRSIAFSRDGARFAAAIDRTVAIWDLTAQGPEPTLIPHDGDVYQVTFSPDGMMLAIGEGSPSIQLRQLSNLSAAPVVLPRHAGTDLLAYNDEGSSLTAVGHADEARGWSVAAQVWRVPTKAIADDVCTRIRGNLPAVDWERFIGADIPYERTCANKSVHPAFFMWAEDLAREGQIDRAIAAFQRMDELDHPNETHADRGTEVKRLAASGLLVRGDAMARHGDIERAAAIFREAIALDPSQTFDPGQRAKKSAASEFVRRGNQHAQEGDFETALALLTQAKAFDPSLELDPKAQAARAAAFGLVDKGKRLVLQGEVKQAVAAFARAQELNPELMITGEDWNVLCWNGSLRGHADEVLSACDRAVETDEGYGSLDSRAVARALTGDRAGAIKDFRDFVEDSHYPEEILEQRKLWIKGLERGENPLTPEVLAELLRTQSEQ